MQGHYQSFVVRVWVLDGRVVRGIAVHSQTGEVASFTDPDELPGLLRRMANGHGGNDPDEGGLITAFGGPGS
jgi:hypothetical protein